jgi:CubicO group peptidase (beta-lactamase class C family)
MAGSKRYRLKGALLLLFLFVANLLAQQTKLQNIDSFITKAMKDWKMPGFSIAVVKNDSVIFAKGYGLRDITKKDSVDEKTLFVIASCTKAFTTASLARLVDEGKIQWDDPVTKYLPDFQMYDPWVTREITIRDLVTHRSGLATFSGDILWLGSTYDAKEVIRRARFLKPTSGFRSRYGYQNIMFSAAGQIIPAVTDTSWQDYIKTHFLLPLGMKRSDTSISDMIASDNIAAAHQNHDGKIRTLGYYRVDNVAPAAAINSCAIDMAQWIRLQLGKGLYAGKRIFSEKESNEMWSNQTPIGAMNYGLGWFISYRNGKKTCNHGGGMPGMISDVTLVPEDNFGFVLLSNLETGMVAAVRSYILDIFSSCEPKDWEKIMLDGWIKREERFTSESDRRESIRAKDSKPSLPLEKYCGIYEDKMYGNAEVALQKEKLFLRFIPSPTFRGELKHYQYDMFYIDWDDPFLTRGYVKFDMKFTGEIGRMTLEVPNSPDFIFTELSFDKIK